MTFDSKNPFQKPMVQSGLRSSNKIGASFQLPKKAEASKSMFGKHPYKYDVEQKLKSSPEARKKIEEILKAGKPFGAAYLKSSEVEKEIKELLERVNRDKNMFLDASEIEKTLKSPEEFWALKHEKEDPTKKIAAKKREGEHKFLKDLEDKFGPK